MFDWLHVLGRRLGYFIVHVPLYVAGPAMIVIGALDSSLLSLPEVNDYLVVARCYTHPRAVFFFPLFAAIGSVLGCLLLYTILRRGGQAFPHRRFLLTIFVARSLRYYTEGTLAVFYGERVVRFLKDNGIIIISVVTGICLIALATYLLSGTGRAAVKVGKETR